MHKIMVVDDETIITTQLEEVLTSMGYKVVGKASSAKASISMAKRLSPDLILMDIVMPGKLDGIDASQAIKAELDIPVIFLTAYADDKFIERAKNVEPYGYIVKPFQEKEIKATIEVALHKKDMERQLHESEEKYRSVVDDANDAISSADSRGNIIFWNKAAETVFGYSADEAVGKSLTLIIPQRFRKAHQNGLKRAVSPAKSNIVGRTVEMTGLRKDGSEFPIESSFATWKIRKGIFFTCITRDITNRTLAERGLKSLCQQLHDLCAYLQSIREEEKTYFAREIHDELGQSLMVLKIELSLLGKRLPKDQEVLLERIKPILKLIDMTIQTLRRISTELRPELLDDLGLPAAMEWQADEFQNRTGIKCKVTFDPRDIILDKHRSTAIFRIFQEALTNVARHANATRVKVSLKKKVGKLVLKVSDNGKGITEKQISDPKSFGLIEIRERARFSGGDVKISGVKDKGTTVTVSIPLERKGG